MELSSVSNNIRKLRFLNKEMSQVELAGLVNCTRQTIISLEQNKYSPSLILSAKIAKVFNKGIEDVFNFEFKL